VWKPVRLGSDRIRALSCADFIRTIVAGLTYKGPTLR
jgi:hypothetical protein